tara:strand:- start:740 stop:1021 length:282 start_codon:yes stop_codon:yes gene_type:complete
MDNTIYKTSTKEFAPEIYYPLVEYAEKHGCRSFHADWTTEEGENNHNSPFRIYAHHSEYGRLIREARAIEKGAQSEDQKQYTAALANSARIEK